MTIRISVLVPALASACALAFAANAQAAIVFTNLGTNAPPATLGGHAVTPFQLAPQYDIPDYSEVFAIPGVPRAGTLEVGHPARKYPFLNVTWSNFAGPFYLVPPSTSLQLPAGTHAFYFYAHGNTFGTSTFTVTADSATSSGPVTVVTQLGAANATGFAFHATAGEAISTITIASTNGTGNLLGDFGIDTVAVAGCASDGYTGTKLAWCVKICESGISGRELDTWIQRWVTQFRALPHCALPGGGTPPV